MGLRPTRNKNFCTTMPSPANRDRALSGGGAGSDCEPWRAIVTSAPAASEASLAGAKKSAAPRSGTALSRAGDAWERLRALARRTSVGRGRAAGSDCEPWRAIVTSAPAASEASLAGAKKSAAPRSGTALFWAKPWGEARGQSTRRAPDSGSKMCTWPGWGVMYSVVPFSGGLRPSVRAMKGFSMPSSLATWPVCGVP